MLEQGFICSLWGPGVAGTHPQPKKDPHRSRDPAAATRGPWESRNPPGGAHRRAGEECEDPPPEKEVVAERCCDDLMAFPVPLHRRRGGGRELRGEIKLGKKGGVVRRWFYDLVLFLLTLL